MKQTSGVNLPRSDELPRGGIVGQVDVIDVVRASPSRWFEGPYGLVFANAQSLRFAACRGRLGFFEPLQEVVGPKLQPGAYTLRTWRKHWPKGRSTILVFNQ